MSRQEFYELEIENLKSYLKTKPGIVAICNRLMASQRFKWALIGALTWAIINTLLGISLSIMVAFSSLLLTFTYWFSEILLGNQGGLRLIELLKSSETVDPYVISDFFVFATDMVLAGSTAIAKIGHGFWQSFEISFPMLRDIDFDLDWIHLSLPQLARTVFAFLQFIILFYIFRRVRRAIKLMIRKRISLLNNDYFDKQYFGVISVV